MKELQTKRINELRKKLNGKKDPSAPQKDLEKAKIKEEKAYDRYQAAIRAAAKTHSIKLRQATHAHQEEMKALRHEMEQQDGIWAEKMCEMADYIQELKQV